VKSAADLELRLENEKVEMLGYQPPPAKTPRRFFKNFFALKYATNNDKFLEEKLLLERTNPVATARASRREFFEGKTALKRHHAALLKDKIMMGG
jgi:hypothetical protein